MKKFYAISIFLFIISGAAFSQTETLLIYREEITNNEPRLSLLMRIKNDEIISYVLSNELFNSPYFLIELTEENLSSLREALNRFLEWETTAIENNLDSFTRAVPVTVRSRSVTWSWSGTRLFNNKELMTINFQFDWNPSRRKEYRALLNISSNTLSPVRDESEVSRIQSYDTDRLSFTFQKNYMNNEAVSRLLENISEEKISLVIEQRFERETESERQRSLIEELFL